MVVHVSPMLLYVHNVVAWFPNPQGYGTNFYGPEEYYEGEWYADKRSGWGRMYYADGSVYEGEWYDDKRNGKGLLKLGEETEKPLVPLSKPRHG